MGEFEAHMQNFFQEFGSGRHMVLSTSLHDHVTSRMMSVVQMDGLFWFQTDRRFRKYSQLAENPRVALCADNIQIEGLCREAGRPLDNAAFAALYRARFPSSFGRYTHLSGELLFAVTPVYLERWLYRDGEPYLEQFLLDSRQYRLSPYCGG